MGEKESFRPELTALCDTGQRVRDAREHLLRRLTGAVELVIDLAVAQEEDAPRVGGGLDRVRDHEYGLALLIYFTEHVEQGVRRTGVKRARGLVREDDARAGDERAGDCGALLFTA